MSDLAADIERLAHDLTVGHFGEEPDSLALWEEVRTLGLDRIGISEDLGGSGGSTEDLVTTVSAFSREGWALPLVENAAAVLALTGGQPLDEGWATIAVANDRFVLSGERLSGTFRDIPWLSMANRVVVCLSGVGLVAVTRGVAGARIEQLTYTVSGEPVGTLVLDDVAVDILDADSDAVFTRWQLLEVVALIGSARGAYELTTTYVKSREQFGNPLVAIPAVASNLAQMSVQLLLADCALSRALDDEGPDPQAALEGARVIAAQTGTVVARIAHQLHGAMGTTREYPLHRFTTSIWSRRDRAISQHAAALGLGRRASNGGEGLLWDTLTQ